MSRFFVGQRVRLVAKRPDATSNIPIGSQGRVSSIGPFRAGDLSHDGFIFRRRSDLTVLYDSGEDLASLFCHIEPILPEGHKPCEDQFNRDLDKLLEGVPA